MRERDLPFDRSKHAVYSKKAKKCVRKLLRRYYDEATAAELWEKVQRQYRWIADAAKNDKKRNKLKDMLVKNFGMDMDAETDAFMDQFAGSMVSLHPKTVAREFYSDYVTPLEDDIHADGTTVHIIYALKMGEKYEKRYLKHFRDPDIIPFDMQHEAWIFQSQWTQPILDAIAERMR